MKYMSPSRVIKVVLVLPAVKVLPSSVPDIVVPSADPIPTMAIVPVDKLPVVPAVVLMATAPKPFVPPIIPLKSTAPEPELIVKVSLAAALVVPSIVTFPSRVSLPAVFVSMVVLPARDNAPVIVTVPLSLAASV